MRGHSMFHHGAEVPPLRLFLAFGGGEKEDILAVAHSYEEVQLGAVSAVSSSNGIYTIIGCQAK